MLEPVAVMIFGQLYGCERLRELVSVISAHSRKSYHLGFGKADIKLANLAKANVNRDYRIFEEFARKLIEIAQNVGLMHHFTLTEDVFRSRWHLPSSLEFGSCKVSRLVQKTTDNPEHQAYLPVRFVSDLRS